MTYKNSVRTSKEKHYASATKNIQLMLFRDTMAVYCENHMEHTNKYTLWAEYSFTTVKQVVHVVTTGL
jgi:hypothetical protein